MTNPAATPCPAASQFSAGLAPPLPGLRSNPEAGLALPAHRSPGAAGRPRRRTLRAVLRDRRGATAMIVAASAVTLFGFAALATEGGNWYYTHRNARSAADMAALAGTAAYHNAGTQPGMTTAMREAAARAAVLNTAERNGFGAGGRTTVIPEFTSFMGNSGAVRVTVTQRQPTFVTGLLTGSDEVAITARAMGALVDNGNACILALTGQLKIAGNFNVVAPDCVLASNATDSQAVKFVGSASVTAYQLRSSGGCHQCASNVNPATVPGGFITGQPPVRNPYENINPWISGAGLSPNSGPLSACYNINFPNGNGAATVNVPATHGGRITTICNSVTVSKANHTLNFAANGTYVFYGAGLEVKNGSLNCSGCTFIFTGGQNGAQTGDIHFNANGNGNVTVNLSAPITNSWNPIFDGVAIYRDHRAPANGNAEVQINGGQNVRLGGALVFPSSDVRFNGNSTINNNACGILIGASITLNGNSGYSLASAEVCAQRHTQVPRLQVVRLVE